MFKSNHVNARTRHVWSFCIIYITQI